MRCAISILQRELINSCHWTRCLIMLSFRWHVANCRYPEDAWEVMLGYVQERMMGDRAGAALIEDIKAVDAQAEQ